ncbi:MAG: hypothetical protein ACI3XT_03940 [Butyricicoccaceae bacterium]
MIRYDIVLHSPMGPRRGTAEILDGQTAAVCLLGRRSLLALDRTEDGACRLSGTLDSVMGDIAVQADIRVENGQFRALVHTSKGDMPLTGTQKEDGVFNGN